MGRRWQSGRPRRRFVRALSTTARAPERMRLVAPAVALVLVACSSAARTADTSSSAATTTSATTTSAATTSAAVTTSRPAVQEIIDVGGGQLLGMAASPDSVWAISFDNGTMVQIDPATNDVGTSVQVPG